MRVLTDASSGAPGPTSARARSWEPGPGATAVEAELLDLVLGMNAAGRLLEVGTGSGRLSGRLHSRACWFVGIDSDRSAVRAASSLLRGVPTSSFVTADAEHLPFRDAAFDVVVLHRIYHRFPDPAAALGRIGRLLGRGGVLIVSFTPRPTIGTLGRDLHHAVLRTGKRESLTFSRTPSVVVRSGVHPGHVTTVRETRRALELAGFRVESTLGFGFEAVRRFDRLPPRLFIRLAPLLGHVRGGAPMLMVRARKVESPLGRTAVRGPPTGGSGT